MTLTVTTAVFPAYPPPEALRDTVTDSLAASSSFTPVTVTVCMVFQLVVMKLSSAGDTVTASVSPENTVTVTAPGDCVASLAVKVPEPASLTVRLLEFTTRSAVSLSVMDTMASSVYPGLTPTGRALPKPNFTLSPSSSTLSSIAEKVKPFSIAPTLKVTFAGTPE